MVAAASAVEAIRLVDLVANLREALSLFNLCLRFTCSRTCDDALTLGGRARGTGGAREVR